MSTSSLAGKTAIVTGASSGLGHTFVAALADAGARVVLAARRADRLEAFAGELTARGATALPIACDVTDPAAVAAMVDLAYQRFGQVDVLRPRSPSSSTPVWPRSSSWCSAMARR